MLAKTKREPKTMSYRQRDRSRSYPRNNKSNSRKSSRSYSRDRGTRKNSSPPPQKTITWKNGNNGINDVSKLIIVDVELHGQQLRAALDTGADCSIMSKDTAEQLGIFLNHQNQVKITGVNGEPVSVIGVTDSIPVSFQNSHAELKFHVTNLSAVDILLGYDWACQTNPIIDWTNKSIHFKGCDMNDDDERQSATALNAISLSMDENDEISDLYFSKTAHQFTCGVLLAASDFSLFQFLISDNIDVFSFSINDLGECNLARYKLETSDETPYFAPPYRQAESLLKTTKKMLLEWLEAGIISKGDTGTWAHPGFLIEQKSGYRFVVNYKYVNSLTLPLAFPIPRIDEILTSLRTGRFFTTLDCRKGYLQVPLDEQSRNKTGFVVPFGIFKFNRVPFGLRNAPAFFSMLMSRLLGHLPFVKVYIDDIIVFSSTLTEHFEHLRTVFAILRKANLKLNPEKCQFICQEVKVLGHIV